MEKEKKVAGVIFLTKKNKWRVRIKVDGKIIHIGYFDKDKYEDAVKARDEAEKKYWTEEYIAKRKAKPKPFPMSEDDFRKAVTLFGVNLMSPRYQEIIEKIKRGELDIPTRGEIG